jgi:hypothetical protein
MDRKILYQPWGGLGDNLQYSTLPKRFAEIGIDFYISDKNVYRNNEIYSLVWGMNPYVKGINSEEYNSGDIDFNRNFSNKNIIYNQESIHGLNPINEIPEIYYNPGYIKDVEDSILIDVNTVTLPPEMSDNIISELREKYPNREIVAPRFKNKLANNLHKKNITPDRFLDIESIFHYCDVIHSSYHFICPFSGQSVLAAALDKKETTCYIPNNFISHLYVFPNINYHIYK